MNCILNIGGFQKAVTMPSTPQFIYIMNPESPEAKYSTLPYSEINDKLKIDIWVFRIDNIIDDEVALYKFYGKEKK